MKNMHLLFDKACLICVISPWLYQNMFYFLNFFFFTVHQYDCLPAAVGISPHYRSEINCAYIFICRLAIKICRLFKSDPQYVNLSGLKCIMCVLYVWFQPLSLCANTVEPRYWYDVNYLIISGLLLYQD